MLTLERIGEGSALVRGCDPGPATCPAAEVEIAQRIRIARGPFFWAVQLLPAPRRKALHAHCIFATMPSYVLAQPALPQVCNALAERAAAHFADAECAIGARPQWAMLAVTAMLSSYRTLLEGLLARGWARLDEPVRIPAWRQTALLVGHGLVGR